MSAPKHTPGPAVRIAHVVHGREQPWAWTGKPSARDLRDHGGAAEVRASYRFPIGYRVRWHTAEDGWVVEALHIVGTRGAVESWVETDTHSTPRFSEALTVAQRLCRAAIAKAEGVDAGPSDDSA